MVSLTPEVIRSIEQVINKNRQVEIKVERGRVVVVETVRKVKIKA